MPRKKRTYTISDVAAIESKSYDDGYKSGTAYGQKIQSQKETTEANVEVLKARAECLQAMAKGLYSMAITLNGTSNWPSQK